ncbi:MAG TPA: Xaa-Pro peptidase family protein [Chloroflexia bacterium]|nr:Xaa-Pro peptidase family protein [Chloroflexia bacterium]
MTERLQAFRSVLANQNIALDGLFITKPENRAYLSGFTGSFGYLLVTNQAAILFTDGRYVEQAAAQAPGWEIIRLQRPFEESVVPELKRLEVARLGFEADHLSFNEYQFWTSKTEKTEWIPTTGLLAQLRQRKGQEEVTAIKRAIEISEKAFEHLLGLLQPGLTERDAAAELEYAMRKYGADAIAFDTIVASGSRGALPHGRASDKKLEAGEFITFDFGARWEGYNADITRTVFLGAGQKPDNRQVQVYNLVKEAQLAGIEAVQAGTPANTADSVVRIIFEKAKMLEYYLHSTGHNLGREVHEAPFLTPSDTTLLEPGMVLTVEPGLYISDWGGVRIEDDLLVTETGVEVLPHLSKDLIVL